MTPERKTYVTFFYPGSFVDNTSGQEVTSRNPEDLEVPEGAFAFQFHDVMVATTEVDDKEMELSSDSFNSSPKYYYGGRILTVEDVEREIPNNDILLSNMRGNGWDRVIQTSRGNIQPFDKDCVFIEAA